MIDFARLGDYSAHVATPVLVAQTGPLCPVHWYDDPSARGLLAGLVVLVVRILWGLWMERRKANAPPSVAAARTPSTRPPSLPLTAIAVLVIVACGCNGQNLPTIPTWLYRPVAQCVAGFLDVGVKQSQQAGASTGSSVAPP